MEDNMLQNAKLEDRIESIRKKLEGEVIRQAQIVDMVRNISRIEVFPAYMDIYFDSWALMGFSSGNVSSDVKDETDKLAVFRVGRRAVHPTSP